MPGLAVFIIFSQNSGTGSGWLLRGARVIRYVDYIRQINLWFLVYPDKKTNIRRTIPDSVGVRVTDYLSSSR